MSEVKERMGDAAPHEGFAGGLRTLLAIVSGQMMSRGVLSQRTQVRFCDQAEALSFAIVGVRYDGVPVQAGETLVQALRESAGYQLIAKPEHAQMKNVFETTVELYLACFEKD